MEPMINSWSVQALQVLGLFRDGQKRHGFEVARATQLADGIAYPILYRFEREGLLVRELERVDPSLSSRQPRTFYKPTTAATDTLAQLRSYVGATS